MSVKYEILKRLVKVVNIKKMWTGMSTEQLRRPLHVQAFDESAGRDAAAAQSVLPVARRYFTVSICPAGELKIC